MKKFLNSTSQLSVKGFTLIELLIVIAVIGVLAAVILVAIDPIEQLARGRDAGRKSSVNQLGRALQAYYSVNSAYPAVGGWVADPTNTLIVSGEIKVFPTNPVPPLPASPLCTGAGSAIANNFCYKLDTVAPNIVVYTLMESKSENRKGVCPAAEQRWYLYASINGRGGIICGPFLPDGPDPITSFTFF
jgi:prepilin-type N-terminal cleavage/methylation domain-containing protein